MFETCAPEGCAPGSSSDDNMVVPPTLPEYFAMQLKGESPLVLPAGYSRGMIQIDDETRPTLRHEKTGVAVWSIPFKVCEEFDNTLLLYLYMKWAAFRCLIEADSWHDWLTSSWTKDGVISMMASPPDKFQSKDAILANIYTNAADVLEQQRAISKHQGNADYCMPFVIPRSHAYDAMRDHVPGVVGGPGYNRKGEALRPDRDIWVVNLMQSGSLAFPQKQSAKQSTTFESPRTALLRVDETKQDREFSKHLALKRALRNAEDANPVIRKLAAQTMGQYMTSEDEDAKRALERLKADTDGLVRVAAAQVLFKFDIEKNDAPGERVEVDRKFIQRHMEGRRQSVAPMEDPVPHPQKIAWFPQWNVIGSYLGFACGDTSACESDSGNCRGDTDQHEFSLVEQSHFAQAHFHAHQFSEKEGD
jgi:hypothetical protein